MKKFFHSHGGRSTDATSQVPLKCHQGGRLLNSCGAYIQLSDTCVSYKTVEEYHSCLPLQPAWCLLCSGSTCAPWNASCLHLELVMSCSRTVKLLFLAGQVKANCFWWISKEKAFTRSAAVDHILAYFNLF